MTLYGLSVKNPSEDIINFDSSKDRFKVELGDTPSRVDTLTYTFLGPVSAPRTGSGVTTTTPLVTVIHGLGYVPASSVSVYTKAPDNGGALLPFQSYYLLGSQLELDLASSLFQYLNYTIDSNKLVINYNQFDNPSIDVGTPYTDPTGLSLLFKYFIFSNSGA